MRADGRVAIFNCDTYSPFRLTSLGTFPYEAGKKDIRAINISCKE